MDLHRKLELAYQYLQCNSNLVNFTTDFQPVAGSYIFGGWRVLTFLNASKMEK